MRAGFFGPALVSAVLLLVVFLTAVLAVFFVAIALLPVKPGTKHFSHRHRRDTRHSELPRSAQHIKRAARKIPRNERQRPSSKAARPAVPGNRGPVRFAQNKAALQVRRTSSSSVVDHALRVHPLDRPHVHRIGLCGI